MNGPDKQASRPKARQSIAHIPSSSRLNSTDKQNVTTDLSAAQRAHELHAQPLKKRTRGKSLGPGGLEALNETNGNIIKNILSLQPRSILKPAIPLTPPKSIPTFDELRQRSTRKRSPAKSSTEALLIDFSTPGPGHDGNMDTSKMTSKKLLDPFSPVKTMSPISALNQSGDGVDEDERSRQEQKRAVLEQRAARRKSMANRRVSFAPEATLHTWSVMEMAEDSTTSSTSNSTRRQSSMTAEQTPQRNVESVKHDLDVSEPPSTLPAQTNEPLVKGSPAHQRELHQMKERRSSAISEDMEISEDEAFSSSPSGDVATESSPIRVEDSIDSESDTDGDTAMSVDDTTQNTLNSQRSSSSTHSSLEDRLRQAATQAGTRGIEYDEHGGEISMEIASDTVTKAFQPWTRAQQQKQDPIDDQENVNLFSSLQSPGEGQAVDDQSEEDVTQGMTMEITRAVGGILRTDPSTQQTRRKSVTSRSRSSLGRRRSMGVDSSYGDETMEFTTMAGGILSGETQQDDDSEDTVDKELTMEFTTAVGGFQDTNGREYIQSMFSDENETMDMTAAVGGILAPIEEQTEPQTDFEDKTIAMEMTKAIGRVLSEEVKKHGGKQPMPEEAYIDIKEHLVEPEDSLQVDEGRIASTPKQFTSIASETGSPSLALKPRSSGRTRSARVSHASTPKSSVESITQRISSVKEQATPTKQLTPLPTRAKTPERTPLSANIAHRGASPKKLFQAEIKARASPASIKKPIGKQGASLFAQDEVTGRQTPRVVLHAPKPHQYLRRRSSGVGIDREGIGSPSVTQLLARRSSISDAAPQFKLEPVQTARLRFEDPKQIAQEIDAERAEDERRESGRFVMEQEANEQQEENATLQLKDMIESMTPKKNNGSKLKGRKSFAVGSARGLLGKRPLELDNDEEDGDGTPKRLKAMSREGSPVKKIYLPKPPSKEETTGRLTKAEQQAVNHIATGNHTPALDQSPFKTSTGESPRQPSRYRDVPQDASLERPTSFEDKLDNVIGAVDPTIEHPPADRAVAEEDKISLQQFLNMTNIHFIELNTTKRRHTITQSTTDDTHNHGDRHGNSITTCFIAATTTMPLLELYQHATKELKTYISTGRKIIRSIESETLTEQPALFREYVEARPDVKLVMDNQFRNGKTNARLQSKQGWYTWRSQLVDGLHSGLQSIRSDMEKDLVVVEEQANALGRTVPLLADRCNSLAHNLTSLQQRLKDMESVDHRALRAGRKDLRLVDQQFHEKLAILKALQQQIEDKDEALSQASELKEEMQDQIAEANRVREEHQGWAAKDVLALKHKMDKMRKESGWSLISAEEDLEELSEFGVALTMSYKDSLRLFFYPSAYEQASSGIRRRSGRGSRSVSGPTAPISLTYSPLHDDDLTIPQLTTEQRFFLQLIRSQLHAFSMMPKSTISARRVLETVSSGWEMACKISEEIRLLNLVGMTRVSIEGDERLGVKVMLITDNRSRVDIEFKLNVAPFGNSEISVSTSVDASAVYGPVTSVLDVPKTRKVQTALNKEVENKTLGEGAWHGAVRGFEEWFCTQMQAQQQDGTQTKQAEAAQVEELAPAGSTTPKSPIPASTRPHTVKRSPLATKKSSVVQKKTIPVPTSRQDKFRTSQREQQIPTEKIQVQVQDSGKDKENVDPFTFVLGAKPPAITPEMQEAMMQRTPIKRIGALKRSPI